MPSKVDRESIALSALCDDGGQPSMRRTETSLRPSCALACSKEMAEDDGWLRSRTLVPSTLTNDCLREAAAGAGIVHAIKSNTAIRLREKL